MSQMTESYGPGASDGYWDGVDNSDHMTTGSNSQLYGGIDPVDVRNAGGIIIGALALLWLLGGVVFKRVNE